MLELPTYNINILGREYDIDIRDPKKDDHLKKENNSGYCFFDAALIVVSDFDVDEDWKREEDDIKIRHFKEVLRHEIIHAFLFESGLTSCSLDVNGWACNEEMVDWIALQFPKILSVFEELDIVN